jgi:hypothetical protein
VSSTEQHFLTLIQMADWLSVTTLLYSHITTEGDTFPHLTWVQLVFEFFQQQQKKHLNEPDWSAS